MISDRTSNLPRFQRPAILALGFVVFVILWGALVRATGSGAGCGSHWPLCNGELVPGFGRIQTRIEFFHRLTSGLSLLAVVALAVRVYRAAPPRHLARKAAILSGFAMVLEALIGAALVLLRLVEHDQSVDRAVSIVLHLVNTCFLTGALTVLIWSCRNPQDSSFPVPGRISVSDRWKLGFLLGGFVLLGTTGALTALGDTLFGSTQNTFSSQSHFLVRLRIFHPVVALAWAGYAIPWLLGPQERGKSVAGLLLLNLALGTLNVYLQAPVAVQILHLAVANALWIGLVWECANRFKRVEGN